MIVLAATFVADPLLPVLRMLLTLLGVPASVVLAPYHQVFQQLLTPAALLRSNPGGHNVVVLRLQDFLRDVPMPDDGTQLLARICRDLVAAVTAAVRGLPEGLTLLVLPVMVAPADAHRSALLLAHAALCRQLACLEGVMLLDPAPALAQFDQDGHDAARDRLAHIPFTDLAFAALARLLARSLHAVYRPAQKVLVLDCDHTLWQGVVGEVGPAGVTLPDGCIALQAFAAQRVREGVLVCLASKNSAADVHDVFALHPQMPLRLEDVVAQRVNWLPKADNLQALASELGLGLDAFVFLDDNPVECAAMRAAQPLVMTLQVPPADAIAGWLDGLWMFDCPVVTQEDAQRTRMVRENAGREALGMQSANLADFLAQLELQVAIGEPAEADWPRLAQLTQRTNQFNCSTRRRTEGELRMLQAAGARVLAVRVRDRFGDYGLVGLLVTRTTRAICEVDTFLLSCRVLGRGVEHAMLRALAAPAEGAGCAVVSVTWIGTPRNEPARAFLAAVAAPWGEALPEPAGCRFDIPVAVVAQVQPDPGGDPVPRASDVPAIPPIPPIGPPVILAAGAPSAGVAIGDRAAAYAHLALHLRTPADLVAAVQAQSQQVRALPGTATAPRDADEAAMLEIWCVVLNRRGLGVEDDFFALGGTSLDSVSLFLAIEQRFGVSCPLTTILQASTPRALSQHLVQALRAQPPVRVVPLRPGGPRAAWLVHDGFGETLLYHHLAQRFPSGVAVYGIEPAVQPGIALAHPSIEAMAQDYVRQVRVMQPEGPYLLGGTCAGGMIAYQMAVELRAQGEGVQQVLILDGATPQARKRRGRLHAQRLARVIDLLSGGTQSSAAIARPSPAPIRARPGAPSGSHAGPVGRLAALAGKTIGLVRYEAGRIARAWQVRQRLRLLRHVLRTGQRWPQGVEPMRFSEVYRALEARYVPPRSDGLAVLLVRAGTGQFQADTPCREIYREATFGWGGVVTDLQVLDVPGGHVSMLNAESVDALWQRLGARLWPQPDGPAAGQPS